MSAYNVEYRGKKAGKVGSWWVVITPANRIANDYYHPTEVGAKRHCRNLNAFFGESHETR